MLEQAVSSLAILKVNWDKGHSYVDNFVPFVAECLRTGNVSEISLPELQKTITDIFGIIIPQSALKVILSRVFRVGYIKYQNGVYVKTEKLDSLPNIVSARDNAVQQYEALINKLEDYCRQKYQKSWTREQAENALQAYLEEHSISILKATAGSRLILAPEAIAEHSSFLIKSFILNMYENDSEGFDFLETVVKGRLLANMLFFPDISNVNQRIKKLDLYLDTRLIIRLLGWAGPHFQAPCQELVDVFKEENVNLAVFDHTLNEIYGILDATAFGLRTASSRRRAHGEIADYFIPQGKRSSDIEFIISRLPEILNKHKINIVDRPSHAIPLGLDETEFTRILQEEVRYQRKEPLQHDIDALTSIHRLRKGQLSRSIESCKSIFVTTNISLARACARFFRKEYHGTTVPLCTVDNVLTTIMWVKKPITAPDLPKKRIIADCYAALNPQDNLWKIYLDEIDRLQVSGDLTDDDYNLLRYSTEARRALMDVTLGEFEAFVEGSVYEVLNRAKENLRAELEKALRLEEEQKLKALQQYDEQRDLIGKQQTIIDEQHLERLRQLSEFKAKLDQRAVAAINNSVKLYFSFICLLWLVIISFIFKFGWDVMEPWTYILGGSVPILSLGYFAARQHEFSPKTIYDKYVKAKKIKNYQEYGFDINEFELPATTPAQIQSSGTIESE